MKPNKLILSLALCSSCLLTFEVGAVENPTESSSQLAQASSDSESIQELKVSQYQPISKRPVPDKIIPFKNTEKGTLDLHVFFPKKHKLTDKVPVGVFFFGGGWQGGSPTQFYYQCEYFSSRGMVGISANYRTFKSHGTSPFVCVEDAKSAIRYVRQHAKELGIDPDRIVAGGGSAGGHVAACTGVILGFEDPDEDHSVCSVPNAMVLFNPVLDTTENGYGVKKVAPRTTDISPNHHIRPGLPPTLVLHGTADKTVPYANADFFVSEMKKSGNQAVLFSAKGEGHGFFNPNIQKKTVDGKYYPMTMYQTDVFFQELGYLRGDATVPANITRVAAVGDSNTSRTYPAQLQKTLGAEWIVKNFGRGGATMIEGTATPYMNTDEYKQSLAFLPDVVVIMLGTNDANPKWWTGPRDVQPGTKVEDEFVEKYAELIKSYRELPSQPRIVVARPIPVFPQNDFQIGRSENLVKILDPLIDRVAKSQKVEYLDLYTPLIDQPELSPKGLHLTDDGYKVLAEEIKKCLTAEPR